MAAPRAESAGHVELSGRAVKDLRQLRGKPDLVAVAFALGVTLAGVPLPANADVKALTGHSPWQRMRVGTYRILFRPLTHDEVEALGVVRPGYLVARIVHRSELEMAVSRLGT